MKARTPLTDCFSNNMSYTLDGKLVVAISSRALFDFEEENRLFETSDDSAYMKLQLDRLAMPGSNFDPEELIRCIGELVRVGK